MIQLLSLRETVENEYRPTKSGQELVGSLFVFELEFIGREASAVIGFLARQCDRLYSISLDIEADDLCLATIKTPFRAYAEIIRDGLQGEI
ncbi:MAG: hypothetical protein DI606_16355 [Sphingobium sp.]|uniref:hypothetical protein n=1 Tax=Sphingobium sp. TaxID=1912891 RepID=UPI000DAFD45A|nr:hypothetical protein [Sphingobium sp.]PZU07653.1 MAG: hypothetical protein DI606_16355 [Sphingobium sp.]